ncbi:hypothetical protein LCGC14_2813410 [marine sediment metagenome]|uniref:Uncharacterized protein n=1 Tax=marine sediment metagenome TaxID=412755 RepID=A0A0F8YJ82_9ZZZZ
MITTEDTTIEALHKACLMVVEDRIALLRKHPDNVAGAVATGAIFKALGQALMQKGLPRLDGRSKDDIAKELEEFK